MKGFCFIIVLLVIAVTSTRAGESNIREESGRITMWTDDGLSLSLDTQTGAVVSVGEGKRAVKVNSAPVLRFEEVLEIPRARDLLSAPASDAALWNIPESMVQKDGSVKVTGSDKTKPARVIELNQKEAAPLILAGSCRCKNESTAGGWMNAGLALNAYATYTDGEKMPELSAYFGQYDHGWQFNRRVICPDKPIKQVDIRLTVNDPKCTAHFRGVTLKPARYRITSPTEPCTRLDFRVYQEFNIKDSKLSGLLTYQPSGDYIQIRCRFRSEQKTDRAVSAYVAIPFDAVGGTWYDDVRKSRKIEPGKIYRRGDRWYGAGRDGYDDRYPLACISAPDGTGIAIGTAIDEPRVFQVEYDSSKREFRIRYDIGLSPDAGKWANRGSFTAYLFTFDIKDGFRSAADKYHRIFDWAFKRRLDREGLWMAFTTPEVIPGGSEDFHFSFVESANSMGWERELGMYSMQYVEPWIHHHSPQAGVKEELEGAMDPQIPIATAKRMMKTKGPDYCFDSYYRYGAYIGSYITDNWGQPQGYFFRQPDRKENMMIVNPNPDLPPPDGAAYSSGGWDREIIEETDSVPAQWHIDGWYIGRVAPVPSVDIDSSTSASGKQCVRLSPVRSKTFWEQYARGIEQRFYYKGDSTDFKFSCSAKGDNIPEGGTSIRWQVNFQYEDGSWESNSLTMEKLSREWQPFNFTLKTKAKPFAILVSVSKHPFTVDSTVLWVDDVRLSESGSSDNLLTNGGFESAELKKGKLGGIYLDTMECYLNNLNYRREHWPYAEEPLTFDSARKPALQQQFSHITFAKRASEWAWPRDMIVFANCAPITCFGAPYLDAMGGEEFWVQGDKFVPKSDAEFNFVRFMSRSKPWCLLQYSKMDQSQQDRYFKRCIFYGVYPCRIYHWEDPAYVAELRPFYKKYMPVLLEINKAGWQPLVPAESSNPDIWLECFGTGETRYITVFNPSTERKTTDITLNIPSDAARPLKVFEMLSGQDVQLAQKGNVLSVTLDPEDLWVLRISR